MQVSWKYSKLGREPNWSRPLQETTNPLKTPKIATQLIKNLAKNRGKGTEFYFDYSFFYDKVPCRRHSKEDGSDSSKDSSLQSDTSVDSEDSFASVIFVPKSDPMSPIGGASLSAGPTSPLLKGGCQSAPQSPRIKQSSCPTSPRVKQLPNGIHPLTKQLSSPKVSCRTFVSFCNASWLKTGF